MLMMLLNLQRSLPVVCVTFVDELCRCRSFSASYAEWCALSLVHYRNELIYFFIHSPSSTNHRVIHRLQVSSTCFSTFLHPLETRTHRSCGIHVDLTNRTIRNIIHYPFNGGLIFSVFILINILTYRFHSKHSSKKVNESQAGNGTLHHEAKRHEAKRNENHSLTLSFILSRNETKLIHSFFHSRNSFTHF